MPAQLNKALVEAGLQCRKRLWIDFHRPITAELTASRKAMSEVGRRLLELAQSVFPKGVKIAAKTVREATDATREELDKGASVLFGATFEADGVVITADILVRHKDGAVDLYEIKSGTKIAQRYLNDLALQTHVLEACGHTLRAAFLLHQNPKYEHKAGDDYPPMQLLRSADVTAKVRKQVPHLAARLASFRKVSSAEAMPEVPMGRNCTQPSPCPHVSECNKSAAKQPSYQLPELTRAQEASLRSDGLLEINEVDPERPGLTFSQRRTIESVLQAEPIIESFVRDELRQCSFPLHFISIASITDALPRFDRQRPWRSTPYAWAASTLHEDGRIESTSFAHVERDDPRSLFITALGKHVENGGTVVSWDAEPVEALRALLEDLPEAKAAVRAIVGQTLVDMRQLFETGVFHPELRGHGDFNATVAAFLDDKSGRKLPLQDEDSLREFLDKAWAPRVRSTTREKIATQIRGSLEWRSERMLTLFRQFGEIEEKTPTAVEAPQARSLPKPEA